MDAGIRTVEPSAGTIKRGRGRPPKSGGSNPGISAGNPTKREKTPSSSIAGVEKILFSIHAMAAAFIAPELELAESEAKMLATAISGVNSFYDQVIDPKIVAWAGLIGVAGQIYGPRVGAFMLRKQFEKASKPQRQENKPTAQINKSAVNAFVDPSFVSFPNA